MLLLLLFLVGKVEFEWEDHKYCYFDTTKSWGEAEIACQKWGGHLSSVNSRAEMDALDQKLDGVASYWIGFIDHSGRDTGYQWVDGSGGFTKWADGQPSRNKGSQMCVKVHRGVWDNYECWKTRNFLCKKVSYAVDISS